MLSAETFALKRKLKTILWCANYIQDKGYNKSTLVVSFSFVHVNHSPVIEHKESILLNMNLLDVVLVNRLMPLTPYTLSKLVRVSN